MSNKLDKAFRLTDEEHSQAFERFANAFLVDDYPELEALGGKKDQGMDARIYAEDGKTKLVVQSCVSPATLARTKVLTTLEKLKGNMPSVFIYCTSAVIGTSLDDTRRELRVEQGVTLETCDAAWFVQRANTSQNRAVLTDTYAREVLEPFVRELEPDRLYSLVLSDHEERVALQYLEAVNLDRLRNRNVTKGIFDALIACVTRDSDPPAVVYSEQQIISTISGMFPSGHAPRISEIVPGRIQHLVSKKALHFNSAAGGYVLAFPYRDKVRANIQRVRDRELTFLAALSSAIKRTVVDREIDYEFSIDSMTTIGRQCVLWYLSDQGRTIADPSGALLNILNSERLVEEYLREHPLSAVRGKHGLTEESVRDLLPHALYVTLNSKDGEIAQYLRWKADLFIMHGFLQVTPDVQKACQKLLGGDILYLDTTILVRCIAEYYSPPELRPVLQTLGGARRVGCQLRTWQPYIGELVSHLKGPVLLEWINNFRGLPKERLDGMLRTAPTLINVFYRSVAEQGGTLEGIVAEILGSTNEQENAAEFLREEFGIDTQELPPHDGIDELERQRIFGAWLDGKRRHQNMSEDRFQLLVQNDVNAYVALIKMRRDNRPRGPYYGHKVWYLTLDRMAWRIARVLAPERNALYEVAMGLPYLMNCVATLANIGIAAIPDDLVPATSILDETEAVPKELREIYQAEWRPADKKYLRERRLRELAHQLKGEQVDRHLEAIEVKVDVLPDEDI
jgi:hypothetical protein